MTESSEAGWELAQEVQTRGNFAYTIARWFPWRSRSRAPLGIAAFLAIPLFFCSLMASTLAQEKAHKIQWQGCHHICTVWHDPTSANVARIWLWAFLPSLVLVIVGFIASRLPLGFYVSCVAAIVVATKLGDFVPYLVAACFFILITIPLARFTDHLVAVRERRERAQAF